MSHELTKAVVGAVATSAAMVVFLRRLFPRIPIGRQIAASLAFAGVYFPALWGLFQYWTGWWTLIAERGGTPHAAVWLSVMTASLSIWTAACLSLLLFYERRASQAFPLDKETRTAEQSPPADAEDAAAEE